jgi:hypothetical protein
LPVNPLHRRTTARAGPAVSCAHHRGQQNLIAEHEPTSVSLGSVEMKVRSPGNASNAP